MYLLALSDTIQKSITNDPNAAVTEVGEIRAICDVLATYVVLSLTISTGGSIDAAALIASLRAQLQSQQSDIDRLQVKLTEVNKEREEEVRLIVSLRRPEMCSSNQAGYSGSL